MIRSLPSRNFQTGFDVEEQSFKWTIRNFPLVRKDKSMVNSQKIDFTAGETIGHRVKSTWKVFLQETTVNEKRWIGIFYRIKAPNQSDPNVRNSHAEVTFSIQNENGETTSILFATGRQHIPMNFFNGDGFGFEQFIDADDLNTCTGESLDIHLNFKLYVPSESNTTNSLQTIMEEFQVKLAARAREDLAGLLKNPIPFTDIKIVSNDKKEFSMPRGILAARSDVFAAMLRTDMTEANSGVIQLPDISSKALQVFLNFLYTGELNPEWSHADVVVELTNAAGKYQLKGLLQFLDLTLGKVCQLENVGPLLTFARQLSLKVAEEELLLFVRKKGVDSADNFIRILTTELPVIEPTPTDNSKRKGSKRNRWSPL